MTQFRYAKLETVYVVGVQGEIPTTAVTPAFAQLPSSVVSHGELWDVVCGIVSLALAKKKSHFSTSTFDGRGRHAR